MLLSAITSRCKSWLCPRGEADRTRPIYETKLITEN